MSRTRPYGFARLRVPMSGTTGCSYVVLGHILFCLESVVDASILVVQLFWTWWQVLYHVATKGLTWDGRPAGFVFRKMSILSSVTLPLNKVISGRQKNNPSLLFIRVNSSQTKTVVNTYSLIAIQFILINTLCCLYSDWMYSDLWLSSI
jgi:hypothetical protein